MTARPALRTISIVLACTSSVALGDATVWTNGNGLGGATVRATGADGVTATDTLVGTALTGGVGSPDSTAGVSVMWGPDWQMQLFGTASKSGASYGDVGAAHFINVTQLDLLGSFEPEGPSGTALSLSADGFGAGIGRDIAEFHYAVLGVHPSVIPEGTSGKASDLVDQGIISADDVLFEFFSARGGTNGIDLVELGQTFGRDDLTVLGWIHGVCIDCPTPAASTWGLVAMTLFLLTAGTLLLRHHGGQPCAGPCC